MQTTWIKKDGTRIRIKRMSDEYVSRCITLIRRRAYGAFEVALSSEVEALYEMSLDEFIRANRNDDQRYEALIGEAKRRGIKLRF